MNFLMIACCSENMSLTTTNLVAAKQQTNQVHSAKFEKAGIVTLLLDMTTRVTYEKYTTWFLDVVVVSILQ